VYTLARLKRSGFVISPEGIRLTNTATDWLLRHAATADDQMPGLHYGEAGVALALAEAIGARLIDWGSWSEPYFKEALTGALDWPDLTHGAAGQGIAALECARLLSRGEFARHAEACAEYLMATQEHDGSWKLPAGVPGMEGATYSGFAHGVGGIAYFLSGWSRLSGSAAAADAACRAGQWLISTASAETPPTWRMRTDSSTTWSWWCHGGPGIALAFLELYRQSRDSRYAIMVRRALDIHQADVRYPNLSQCHGLAGLGEVLLEAYVVIGDPQFLFRANKIAALLVALRRTNRFGVYWAVESAEVATADLMVGCCGIAHFLVRILAFESSSLGPPLLPDRAAS
jgi:lantibiotic modifying enzyme